jgi:MFS family permease
VVTVLLRPDPLLLAGGGHAAEQRPPATSLQASLVLVVSQPRALLGLAAIAVSHTVMVGVMTLTPVHMHHGGAQLEVVGLVISMHLAGMYAFSPLVGWASDRFGRVPVLLAGQAVLAAALLLSGTAAAGYSPGLAAALFLLGLGWSAGLIAGSTLLTESVPVPSRPGVQGAADLVMGLTGAVGGAVGGLVVGSAGYGTLNACAAVLVGALVAFTLRARRHPATG